MLKRMFSCALLLTAAATGTASNRLEDDRLVNLDSPFAQGWGKIRFDFQHTWEEGDLLPVADLTLAGGILPRVDLQFETLPHNAKVTAFNKQIQYQSISWEWALKWQILDQRAEWPVSAAVSAHYWRYDAKRRFRDLKTGFVEPAEEPFKYHFITTGGQGILSRDFGFAGLTGVVKWYRRDLWVFKLPIETFFVPAAGGWVTLYTNRKDRTLQVFGDYHFSAIDAPGVVNVWGAGLRFLFRSPHMYSAFVSNTSGDLWEESIYGNKRLFYSFRWGYRF